MLPATIPSSWIVTRKLAALYILHKLLIRLCRFSECVCNIHLDSWNIYKVWNVQFYWFNDRLFASLIRFCLKCRGTLYFTLLIQGLMHHLHSSLHVDGRVSLDFWCAMYRSGIAAISLLCGAVIQGVTSHDQRYRHLLTVVSVITLDSVNRMSYVFCIVYWLNCHKSVASCCLLTLWVPLQQQCWYHEFGVDTTTLVTDLCSTSSVFDYFNFETEDFHFS